MRGLGVLINQLAGRDAAKLAVCYGKVIKSLRVEDHALWLTFEDGTWAKLKDDGQSCCENRYMSCDDDLTSFVGAKLLGGEITESDLKRTGARQLDDYHEIQFLNIQTSQGVFTVVNHNEHNGYYGGFSLTAEVGE